MSLRQFICAQIGLAVFVLLISLGCGQAAEPLRTATKPAAAPQGSQVVAGQQQHPLVPALDMAYKILDHIKNDVKDYTCTLIKHERIGDKLGENIFIDMKVRQQPFSVYMGFLAPEEVKGREVIYIAGKNEGKLAGHEGSGLRARFGTVWLPPTGPLAMAGERYPITEVGVANLTRKLVEVGENDKKFGECEVKFFPGATINDRKVTCIEVMHPVPRQNFRFHLARIYVDEEYNIPTRYEAYDWPPKGSTAPVLLEEYTYVNMKLNVGLTDQDFDIANPNYHFSR